MKAVWRIAGAFFSVFPWQRWINITGGLLLLAGIVFTFAAADPRASLKIASGIALPGAILIGIVPAALGGLALRYVSTRSLSHLRPYGRLRMMLGATLAVSIVAALIALPILANYLSLAVRMPAARLPAGLQPLNWFLVAWIVMASVLMLLFATSWSRTLSQMMPALVVGFGLLAGGMDEVVAPPDVRSAFAVALAAWLAFAIWYLRAANIRRPMQTGGLPLGYGDLVGKALQRLSLDTDGQSRDQALRHYLIGSSSVLASMAAGAMVGLVLIAMTMLTRSLEGAKAVPTDFLFVFAILPATLGFMVTRRARLLWLRAGLPRAALLNAAERIGMQTSLLMYAGGAIMVLAASAFDYVQLLPLAALVAAIIGILGLGLFYFGMSLTRGWTLPDIVLGVCIFVPVVVVLSAIKPTRAPTPTALWTGAIMFLLFTALLRWRALRRWRGLDWRITRLNWMGWTRA